MPITPLFSETTAASGAALPRGTKRARSPEANTDAKKMPGAWPQDDRAAFATSRATRPQARATLRPKSAQTTANDNAHQRPSASETHEQQQSAQAASAPLPSVRHLLSSWASFPVSIGKSAWQAATSTAQKALESGRAWLSEQMRPTALSHLDRLNTQLHEDVSSPLESVAASAKRAWRGVSASTARLGVGLVAAGIAALDKVFSWVTQGLSYIARAVSQSFEASARRVGTILDNARRWLSSTRH